MNSTRSPTGTPSRAAWTSWTVSAFAAAGSGWSSGKAERAAGLATCGAGGEVPEDEVGGGDLGGELHRHGRVVGAFLPGDRQRPGLERLLDHVPFRVVLRLPPQHAPHFRAGVGWGVRRQERRTGTRGGEGAT